MRSILCKLTSDFSGALTSGPLLPAGGENVIFLFMGLLCFQVMMRFVFKHPIYGIDESVTALMIWSMSLGWCTVYGPGPRRGVGGAYPDAVHPDEQIVSYHHNILLS